MPQRRGVALNAFFPLLKIQKTLKRQRSTAVNEIQSVTLKEQQTISKTSNMPYFEGDNINVDA